MSEPFVREIEPGMGLAVAKRTYLREGEGWLDLANRVSKGNSLLHPTGEKDRLDVRNAISAGKFLAAGRHLQHGDVDQPTRNLEVFSNCSTACTSFIKLLLLLNGSGVGRNYSDSVMLVDWANMPFIYPILSINHPDYRSNITPRESFDEYPSDPDVYHLIEDSREGWAKALELLEVATFEGRNYDHFVFDFSAIRENGKPIGGMQNRPASGPVPLIEAFNKVAALKYAKFAPWKSTIFLDHYLAEVVANGGARRSARIGIKLWTDPDILEYIRLKRDNPWMWSVNLSVGVDQEFWTQAPVEGTWGNKVFEEIVQSSFGDGTGEPGIINLDKLTIVE